MSYADTSNQQRAAGQQTVRRIDRLQLICNAFIALFAGIALFVGGCQFNAMHEQSALMGRQLQAMEDQNVQMVDQTRQMAKQSEQMMRQNALMAEQNDQMIAQNKVMSVQAELVKAQVEGMLVQIEIARNEMAHSHAIMEYTAIEQRAWLSVDGVASNRPTAGTPFVPQFNISNTGKVPGNILLWNAYVLESVDIDKEPTTFDDASSDPSPFEGQSIVPPGTSIVAGSDGVYVPTQASIESVQSGQLKLYLVVHIIYSDVALHRHSTLACYVYLPNQGGFVQHTKFNRMD